MAKKVTKTAKDEKDLEVMDDNIEEVDDLETEDTQEVIEEIKEVSIGEEAKVRIRVNKELESYIGDRFYRFVVGQDYSVPKNVKDILKGAGYLDVI